MSRHWGLSKSVFTPDRGVKEFLEKRVVRKKGKQGGRAQ
jgi:hypothetical protein